MRHRIQAVIFDFDYTLADSSEGAVDCVNFALNALGLPESTPDSIRETIGLSLPDTFLRLTKQQYAAKCDEFARLFLMRAGEIMVDKTFLFDSVPEMVRILKQAGIDLGIVSTKFRSRIQAILERENLLDAFDVVVGGEDVSNHKPNPEGLLAAIQQLGNPYSGSLYVGDSSIDAETAFRAGIPFVAVLSGVTPKEDFKKYPVRGIIDGLPELQSLLF